MMQYSIFIQWSEEDQCYIASLPEFGPYVHTHGATYDEALQQAKEVLALLMMETTPLPQPMTYFPNQVLCV
jgi:predicted RNase H-like HicB family nuclease